MKTYLPKSDYVSQGEHLEAGEQIHINHDDCPAGHDSKKRLYIKRTEDGNKLVAYCHHCELSGSYGSRSYRGNKTRQKSESYRNGNGPIVYRLPSDYTPVTKDWSSRGRVWVTKYGISEAEIARYSIGYSEYHRRIILPVYRDGNLDGYQLRRIEDDDDRPKYLTRANKRPLFWRCVVKGLLLSPTLVITEDILSAIKCARFQDSVALLKASETDELVYWIAEKGYNNVIIFLDNDNRQVKQAQLALKNRLSTLAKVKIIHADRDPKEHSNDELRRLLT